MTDSLRRRTALQILWPAIADAFGNMAPPDDDGTVETPRRLNLEMPWYRLAADFALTAGREALQPEGLSGKLPDGPPEPEYDWVGPMARATGTLLHAELERLTATGLAATDGADSGAAARLPYFISRLRESERPGVRDAREEANEPAIARAVGGN